MLPNLRGSPTRLRPGSRVAIVSPSSAGPGVFPHVHELAMKRLQRELQLIPVEYPTICAAFFETSLTLTCPRASQCTRL
ncbi:hypothetical protein V1509DRAFT_91634 [Lipomyces kononenkoae]